MEYNLKKLIIDKYGENHVIIKEEDIKNSSICILQSNNTINIFGDRLAQGLKVNHLYILIPKTWSTKLNADTGKKEYNYDFSDYRVIVFDKDRISKIIKLIQDTGSELRANQLYAVHLTKNDLPSDVDDSTNSYSTEIKTRDINDMTRGYEKLTKREYVAILLGVPDSGMNWIDTMINKSNNIKAQISNNGKIN